MTVEFKNRSRAAKCMYYFSQWFFIIWISGANTVSAGDAPPQAWGYEGGTGPEHWGELGKNHEEHLMCREGVNQSPVNIRHAPELELPKLTCDFSKSPFHIMNNSHTVQLRYEQGSYAVWQDERFDLIQFHFHHPSEHLINGKSYPMEMHVVYKTPGHLYVVIGVFFEIGEHNPHLQKIWERIPDKIDKEVTHPNEFVNVGMLIPSVKEYYHYNGSLTTPPCTENVSWFVLKKPIEVSRDQVAFFEKIIGHNARPDQDLNQRVVVKIKSNLQ